MTILLVRHAESEGNVCESIFDTKPDHAIHLSEKGEKQARDLGIFLKEFYEHNPPKNKIRLWCSPYRRTMLTMKGMKETMGEWAWDKCSRGKDIQFDDRLRERSHGIYPWGEYKEGTKLHKEKPELHKHFRLTRDTEMGRYFAQPYGGESTADVVNRMQTLFNDIHFDIQRGVTDHLIVTHATAMQAFVFGFTKIHPQFLDDDMMADNTGVRLLDIDPQPNRYADYGLIYNPETNIYLLDKPGKPKEYDVNLLWA